MRSQTRIQHAPRLGMRRQAQTAILERHSSVIGGRGIGFRGVPASPASTVNLEVLIKFPMHDTSRNKKWGLRLMRNLS